MLLMTGEDEPAPSQLTGTGRSVRKCLSRHGVSSEFLPRALFWDEAAVVSGDNVYLDDISGMWNIQADAALSHLMDFSDYFVLPCSPLPPQWRMSEAALRDAFCMERMQVLDELFADDDKEEEAGAVSSGTRWTSTNSTRRRLRLRLFGTDDADRAREKQQARLVELSSNPKMLEAAAQTDGPRLIKNGKPKYCQCWFMELDDSEFAKFCISGAPGLVGPALLHQIDEWLPPRP